MRIHSLELMNIGPFKSANIDFIGSQDNILRPPIIIITGENGTGKSIILDAIRTLFYGIFNRTERDITFSNDFLIKSNLSLSDDVVFNLSIDHRNKDNKLETNDIEFNKLFVSHLNSKYTNDFIVDYWTSKLSNDKFSITSIESPRTNNYLDEALLGVHKNEDVTKVITFFDYLRDSKDEKEKKIGKTLYELVKKIIDFSINNGKLLHVSRIKLQPIVNINGKEITLDKLSSGNLYLIQRFTHLLKQLYSVCVTHNISIDQIQEIRGLLLIDEAENHLHPNWQKVFLKNINKLFPHLQIITTTHSPFIVSSIENSKIFVCSSDGESSIIKEETDFYANSPIEDILRSPLFDSSSFNIEITKLLNDRKEAINNNNSEQKKKIEEKLLAVNPDYFNYLKIDEIIKDIKNESLNKTS